MMFNTNFIKIVAGICLANLSGVAYAEVTVPDALFPSTSAMYVRDSSSYMLALNEGNAVIGSEQQDGMIGSASQSVAFEPPLLSGSNAHKYMGLATIALVGLTAVTAPEEQEGATASTTSRTRGTHQTLGRLTAAMAAATVTSGLLTHWDDFHIEDGLTDPDNLHVMLGTLGALAMLNAVSKAPGNGHPGTGIAGGAMMAVAIKLTW